MRTYFRTSPSAKRRIRKETLRLERLECRQLLAADFVSMASGHMPIWAESESACISVPSLLNGGGSDAAGGSAGNAGGSPAESLFSNSSSSQSDAAIQELWVAPGNRSF